MKRALLLLIFFSTSAHAFQNAWYLKAGASLVYGKAKTLNEDQLEDLDNGGGDTDEKYESNFFGGGFNTHFGRRYDRSEFSISSYVFMSSLDRLHFQAGETEITGSGTQRTVSFAPLYKYNFISEQLYSAWIPYISIGPIWALQTIKLENYQTVSGNYNQNYKLVVSSRGGIFAVGIEENLPFKEMHPVYIELAYSYLRAYKSGIIDSSNYAEVQTVSETDIAQYVSGHVVILSMGITVF